MYAQNPFSGLVFGLVRRDRERQRRHDGLETENAFETGNQLFGFSFHILHMELKKPARKINFCKRAFALMSNDLVKMNKLVRLIRAAIFKAKFDDEKNANFHQAIA